ncbi:MAG: cytochrome c [Bryobacteraceae bacterium]
MKLSWAVPFIGALAWAQAKVPAEGAQVYLRYCGACHGERCKGDGPAAKAMKVPPANLTTLAKSNGGQFPAVRLLTILGRTETLTAHGSEEMPVWGDAFLSSKSGEPVAQLRLHNLLSFLEAIQEPQPKSTKPAKPKPQPKQPATSGPDAEVTAGGVIYRANCAVCHGGAADGHGPMAQALKAPPTDLTALTRTHGGKFPSDFIASVLGLMPGTAAHGSADIPVWSDAFRPGEEEETVVQLRIQKLTRYLESIQK